MQSLAACGRIFNQGFAILATSTALNSTHTFTARIACIDANCVNDGLSSPRRVYPESFSDSGGPAPKPFKDVFGATFDKAARCYCTSFLVTVFQTKVTTQIEAGQYVVV